MKKYILKFAFATIGLAFGGVVVVLSFANTDGSMNNLFIVLLGIATTSLGIFAMMNLSK
jgi:hypothetical protein